MVISCSQHCAAWEIGFEVIDLLMRCGWPISRRGEDGLATEIWTCWSFLQNLGVTGDVFEQIAGLGIEELAELDNYLMIYLIVRPSAQCTSPMPIESLSLS